MHRLHLLILCSLYWATFYLPAPTNRVQQEHFAKFAYSHAHRDTIPCPGNKRERLPATGALINPTIAVPARAWNSCSQEAQSWPVARVQAAVVCGALRVPS